MHLPSFGWEPIVVTVDQKYYEERLDYNLQALVPPGLRVEKVKALRIRKPRFIGDIGLRGFYFLLARTLHILATEDVAFLYIPIPSFYCSLIGRLARLRTRVPYGIDYIDPWVHRFPGSDKKFSRHWWSTQVAKYLEPLAVKKASLITGVAEGYYRDVFRRNPKLERTCLSAAMPYGGEERDHAALKKLNLRPYLFSKKAGKFIFVYAGAMLPKAVEPLKRVLSALSKSDRLKNCMEIHFIGTGKTPNDPYGYNVKEHAVRSNLWSTVIFEYPQRIPYLDVLVHLQEADGVFILGSTQPHYTPSKVYQAVLSRKPIFAILHQESTAVNVIRKSGAGIVIGFAGESDLDTISNRFETEMERFLAFAENFDAEAVNMEEFGKYSAYNVTKRLAENLDKVAVYSR